jgi:hypothetical protein
MVERSALGSVPVFFMALATIVTASQAYPEWVLMGKPLSCL